METQTNEQCSAWLSAHGVPENPYGHPDDADGFSLQVRLPAAACKATAILRELVLNAGTFDAVLLHITDWSLYSPDEMAVVMPLRKPSGDDRHLIETPGHIFGIDERDLLIGMMGLVAAYGWTAYVYFDEGLTLLLWEGEIMDVWCPDSWKHQEIIAHVQELHRVEESM